MMHKINTVLLCRHLGCHTSTRTEPSVSIPARPSSFPFFPPRESRLAGAGTSPRRKWPRCIRRRPPRGAAPPPREATAPARAGRARVREHKAEQGSWGLGLPLTCGAQSSALLFRLCFPISFIYFGWKLWKCVEKYGKMQKMQTKFCWVS